MYLDVFDRNPYGTNCWLLAAEGSDEVVVIDPGFEPEAVRDMLTAAGKRPAAVLLTHAHLDHAGTAGSFARDMPVYVHARGPLRLHRLPGLGRDERDRARSGGRPAHLRRRRRAPPGRLLDRGAAHAGAHARLLVLPGGRRRADLLRRPRLRGHGRPIRLRQLRPGGDAGIVAAVPRRCPTTCGSCRATGPRRWSGASAPPTRSCRGSADGAHAEPRHPGSPAARRRSHARAL